MQQVEFPSVEVTSPNWDLLTRVLSELSLDCQILFAASICERTLPIYVSIDFPEDYNHRTLPILREILDYIWDFPMTEIFDREKLHNFLSICQKITSEIEVRGLCCSVEHTAPYLISFILELCLTRDIECLKKVVKAGYAMLWQLLLYMMEEEDIWDEKSLEEQCIEINNDYYSKREIQKEKDDWQILIATPIITSGFIQHFRHTAAPDGCGMVDFE